MNLCSRAIYDDMLGVAITIYNYKLCGVAKFRLYELLVQFTLRYVVEYYTNNGFTYKLTF